jgi:hypothetical protein
MHIGDTLLSLLLFIIIVIIISIIIKSCVDRDNINFATLSSGRIGGYLWY